MRLIDADVLIKQAVALEAEALEYVAKDEPSLPPERWHIWNAKLNERTLFKYDIVDAPTVDAVPVEWAKKWFTRHIDEMFEDYELERDDPNGFNADTIRALANPKISVVHCAVCRFRGNPYCPFMTITEDALYDSTEDDDFCSCGERRDEDETHD